MTKYSRTTKYCANFEQSQTRQISLENFSNIKIEKTKIVNWKLFIRFTPTRSQIILSLKKT